MHVRTRRRSGSPEARDLGLFSEIQREKVRRRRDSMRSRAASRSRTSAPAGACTRPTGIDRIMLRALLHRATSNVSDKLHTLLEEISYIIMLNFEKMIELSTIPP